MEEHKQVQSPRGTTHYWIWKNEDSNAKCIVFTHGLTANHTMFEKQIDFFKKDYTVITWDVPFHGLSRPYKDFTYPNSAYELKAILDKEQLHKVVLVGMSLGGYVCQTYADMFPDFAECFIALDTTPFGFEYYSKSDLWWLNRIKLLSNLYPNEFLRKGIAKAVSITRYSYDKIYEMLAPMTKKEIVEQMDIGYGVFVRDLRDITLTIPTLILLGDQDHFGKVKQYCEEWARRTGFPLHIIKNASHFSNGDNAEQVNEEIKAFIS